MEKKKKKVELVVIYKKGDSIKLDVNEKEVNNLELLGFLSIYVAKLEELLYDDFKIGK